jgi:hypothetical protein
MADVFDGLHIENADMVGNSFGGLPIKTDFSTAVK